MAELTRSELIQQVRAAKPKTKGQRNKIVCALIGHSRIMTYCFGYWMCSRCDEQVGDSLAGVYDGGDKVVVGHDCKTCRANYKKMDWRDKLYAANPFPKKQRKSA